MGKNETDLIAHLADEIGKRVRPVVPLELELWEVAEIAQYLHRSPEVVRNRITPLPGFPKAIRLPIEKGHARPLYKAAEVIEWAEKQREKH